MKGVALRTINIDGHRVFVISRKSRKVKKISELIKETVRYVDPSHESEKPKNPFTFRRASYAKALRAKPLWTDIAISPAHIRNLFDDPTRVCADHLEWVIQLPSKEIVKLEVSTKGISVHGFNRTKSLEKFVNRLVIS